MTLLIYKIVKAITLTGHRITAKRIGISKKTKTESSPPKTSPINHTQL